MLQSISNTIFFFNFQHHFLLFILCILLSSRHWLSSHSHSLFFIKDPLHHRQRTSSPSISTLNKISTFAARMMQALRFTALLFLLAAPLSVLAIPGGACDGQSDGLSITWSGNAEGAYFTFNGGANTGPATGCTDLGSSYTGQVGISYMGANGQPHADGTIFETNPSGYFDVSYILGYTLPVVCSSNGHSTGCAADLFGSGTPCPTTVQNGVCHNPTGPGGSRDPGAFQGSAGGWPWCNACSAPDPFFAPCSGSAYTYPYDDGATVGPATGSIQCCIGTACGITGRERQGQWGNNQPNRDPPCTACSSGGKRSLLGRRWSKQE